MRRARTCSPAMRSGRHAQRCATPSAACRTPWPSRMAVFAPNANSYRRFVSESYAPVAPIWGINNRSVALRVPAGPPRRGTSSIASPAPTPTCTSRWPRCWAAAAMGMRERIDPGPPVEGNGYRAGRASARCRAPGTRRWSARRTRTFLRRDARQGVPERCSSPSSARNARASRPRFRNSTTPGTCVVRRCGRERGVPLRHFPHPAPVSGTGCAVRPVCRNPRSRTLASSRPSPGAATSSDEFRRRARLANSGIQITLG